MKIRAIDVLRNLEGHKHEWDIAGYLLSKSEADVVIKGLELLIKQEGRNDAKTRRSKSK